MNYVWYRIQTDDQLRTISTLKKRDYAVIRSTEHDDVIWTATNDPRATVMLGLLCGQVEEFHSLKLALRKYGPELNIGNIDVDLMGL